VIVNVELNVPAAFDLEVIGGHAFQSWLADPFAGRLRKKITWVE
jgi:hypothetical protein